MSNNGKEPYLTKTQARGEAIDRLLNGHDEKTKIKVLNFIVAYNMDPEHEFFIIFVALGFLKALIETSPKEWQGLFKEFEGELQKWSNTNLETLNHLSQKATITERLASNSESLSNSLIKFLEVSEGLISQLQQSNGSLMNSLSQLQTSETELKSLVEKNNNQLFQLENKIDSLNSNPSQQKKSNLFNKKIGIWKDNAQLMIVTVVLLMTGYFGFIQNQVNQNTNQRVQWLLEKANRMDCRSGIKPPSSPECQGF